ncbi:MAG: TIGR03936 family radical SAM-associated protein [Oscillospiraceae bacterium]|nr:TIGR03936 family radical SAM-associated protein [Oscillospiraceae bacterium]
MQPLPIRIFFRKKGAAIFISHLDLTRCMSRIMRRAKIPFWYTEGFNPHAYMTFALPLSLGITGLYECMDIKLIEPMPFEEIIERLNNSLPEGLSVFAAALPVHKNTAIAWSRYEVVLQPKDGDSGKLAASLSEFLSRESIITEKKNKAKKMVQIDLAPHIKEYTVTERGEEGNGAVVFLLTLPSGCTDNINPHLLLNLFESESGSGFSSTVARTEVLTADLQKFV